MSADGFRGKVFSNPVRNAMRFCSAVVVVVVSVLLLLRRDVMLRSQEEEGVCLTYILMDTVKSAVCLVLSVS